MTPRLKELMDLVPVADRTDVLDDFNEMAGKFEYEAEVPRDKAEDLAAATLIHALKNKDKPR